MATIAVQQLVFAGTAPTLTGTVTASDALNYGNGMNTVAVYSNSSASPVTLTITPYGNNSYGLAKQVVTITVPAHGSVWVPLVRAYDDGNGANTCTVTTSGFSTLTVALVQDNVSANS
jgi:hypothetical protein